MYVVICGNIGCVYDGCDRSEAERRFNGYVEQSKSGFGRAGNENVTMFCDGEIILEHLPAVQEVCE